MSERNFDIINYGIGGGNESDLTSRAKDFILDFFRKIRNVISNVDIEYKTEHRVYCPPELLRPYWSRYQIDLAVMFPGFEKFNLGVEIDGEVGHKHKVIDEYRDQYIYKTHEIPVFRLALDWIKGWMRDKDYLSVLEELIHCHKFFKFGKLPKSPLLHLAMKNRSELFN